MRILIFSWRDIKNPGSGGAEKVTFEIAKRLVKKDHAVTLFTASYPKSLPEEILEGIKIIRRGSEFSVHFLAAYFYFKLGINKKFERKMYDMKDRRAINV